MSLSSSQQFVIICIDYTDQNNQIVCELKLFLKKRLEAFIFKRRIIFIARNRLFWNERN